jgi:flagellar protein FliS
MKFLNVAFAYQEAASQGASPVGMVVLLYDRLLSDVNSAVAAMNARDIETRSAHVNHALLVLQQLQGSLDFAHGGPAARQLDEFYSFTRAKLLEAQIRQSKEMMLDQAKAIAKVRECWAEIEQVSQHNHGTLPASLEKAGAGAIIG